MADDPDSPYLIETPAERRIKERSEQKRRDEKAKRLQLWFNGILTAATIITVGTVLYQNRILDRTLDEIKIGRRFRGAPETRTPPPDGSISRHGPPARPYEDNRQMTLPFD